MTSSPDGELGNQSSPASTLSDRDVAVFWHPCSQMSDYRDFPLLEIVGARGARLMLADGREVLDAISSWWCKSLGHGHAGVRARIEKQLARFEHIIAANTTHHALVELCERLLVMANTAPPKGEGEGDDQDPVSSAGARSAGVVARPDRGGHFGKVFLADNGSTAVEVAMKMALQAQAQRGQPGRTKFAALAGGYHGETIATLSAGDLGLYADPYRPLMFPVHKLTPIPYRVGSHDPAWQDAGPEWEAIERSLAPIAGELAAIIYEPVLQAAGGMRLYSPDLLRRLRKFADQHDVFLIADEIAAGMGRLGTMLASRLADQPPARPAGPGAGASKPVAATLPDFAVFSKGLTAGFLPLSAVLTTEAIYRHFYGAWSERLAFLHSNTYTANALAVAAALGALDAYDNEGVLAGVNTEGPRLLQSLTEVARTSRVLTGVRGLGMMAAVDLCVPDGRPFEAGARMGRQVFREAVKRGALLRPLGDTLYLFPPLNTPAGELDAMVDILAASVAAVVPGG